MSVRRLFTHIEYNELRREYEQTVQSKISKFSEITVLTNVYYDQEQDKRILQLSTYRDDDLYGGEVAIPSNYHEEGAIKLFEMEVETMLRTMVEQVKEDIQDNDEIEYVLPKRNENLEGLHITESAKGENIIGKIVEVNEYDGYNSTVTIDIKDDNIREIIEDHQSIISIAYVDGKPSFGYPKPFGSIDDRKI